MTDPVELGRVAATAPTEDEAAPALSDHDRDLDVLCERWVEWCRTRRLYAPAPNSSSNVLGRLRGSTRPLRPGAGDAISSAELAAFHIAYTCQPPEALDRRVFDCYYVLRLKPVKVAADALGISRKHFYVLLREFRRRVARAAKLLEAAEAENRRQLGTQKSDV